MREQTRTTWTIRDILNPDIPNIRHMTSSKTANPHSAWHRFLRRFERFHLILLIVFVVLVILRLALPYAVKSYVNHQLDKSKDFTGSVGDITMRLWRGGYRIHQIR